MGDILDHPANPMQKEWQTYLREKLSSDKAVRDGALEKLERACFEKGVEIRDKYKAKPWVDCPSKETEISVNRKAMYSNMSSLSFIEKIIIAADSGKATLTEIEMNDISAIGSELKRSIKDFKIRLLELSSKVGKKKEARRYETEDEGSY